MKIFWNRKLRTLKEKYEGENKYFSISRKLKEERKISDDFEVMLASLSLEDLIALKLETAAKTVGGYLYGLPIYSSIPYIAREALLKFALSASRSHKEAALFLGLSKSRLFELVNDFDLADEIKFPHKVSYQQKNENYEK